MGPSRGTRRHRAGPSHARTLREAAGAISGHAADHDSETARDVLADMLAIFGTDAGLQWADAAARLASRFPARWDGASADKQ